MVSTIPLLYKGIPKEAWVIILSRLRPYQMTEVMKGISLALYEHDDDPVVNNSVVNLASKKALMNLKEIADNFWKEEEKENHARTDDDLLALEQCVVDDSSPLANRLPVGKELLRNYMNDNGGLKATSDRETWHGLYNFLFQLLRSILLDIDRDRVCEGIDIFRHNKELLAVAFWIIFGTPSMPSTMRSHQELVLRIREKLETMNRFPIGREVDDYEARFEFGHLLSKARMVDMNHRMYIANLDVDNLYDHYIYNGPTSGGRSPELRAFIGALSTSRYSDIEASFSFFTESSNVDYKNIDRTKCMTTYMYLLALYLYGTFHPVTKKLRERSRIGDKSIRETYDSVVDWLEDIRSIDCRIDRALAGERYISSDDDSDSEDGIFLDINSSSDSEDDEQKPRWCCCVLRLYQN